jgi:hypothetical protein
MAEKALQRVCCACRTSHAGGKDIRHLLWDSGICIRSSSEAERLYSREVTIQPIADAYSVFATAPLKETSSLLEENLMTALFPSLNTLKPGLALFPTAAEAAVCVPLPIPSGKG